MEEILGNIRNDIVSISRSKVVEYLYHNKRSLFQELLQKNILSTEAHDHKVGLSTTPIIPWINSFCVFFGTLEYLMFKKLNPLNEKSWEIGKFILTMLTDLDIKVEEEIKCFVDLSLPLKELTEAWCVFLPTNLYTDKDDAFKNFLEELIEKYI